MDYLIIILKYGSAQEERGGIDVFFAYNDAVLKDDETYILLDDLIGYSDDNDKEWLYSKSVPQEIFRDFLNIYNNTSE
jgi:hypothetical protein